MHKSKRDETCGRNIWCFLALFSFAFHSTTRTQGHLFNPLLQLAKREAPCNEKRKFFCIRVHKQPPRTTAAKKLMSEKQNKIKRAPKFLQTSTCQFLWPFHFTSKHCKCKLSRASKVQSVTISKKYTATNKQLNIWLNFYSDSLMKVNRLMTKLLTVNAFEIFQIIPGHQMQLQQETFMQFDGWKR